jgi:hypothetical protein
MNRIVRTLVFIDALVLSFTLPFTGVYRFHVWMLRSESVPREEIVQAETVEEGAVLVAEASSKTSATTRNVESQSTEKKAATKTSSHDVSWSSRVYVRDEAHARELLYYVAQCESNHNPLAKNKTSSAKGLLQIIDGTWKHFKCDGDVLNAEDNMRCGIKIAMLSGMHHWNPSRHCWDSKISSS